MVRNVANSYEGECHADTGSGVRIYIEFLT